MKTIELEIPEARCLVTTSGKAFAGQSGADNSANDRKLNANVSAYRDFETCRIGDDFAFRSETRGVTFVLSDYFFRLPNEPEALRAEFAYAMEVVDGADEKYSVKSRDDVDPARYVDLLRRSYEERMKDDLIKRAREAKRSAKREGKRLARFRYRIGDRYSPVVRTFSGSEASGDVYEVAKYVYSIGGSVVDSVVMRFVSGEKPERRALTPFDCRAFHLRYEPDLYMFSMNSGFRKLDSAENKKE